jgi:hypothetical protein
VTLFTARNNCKQQTLTLLPLFLLLLLLLVVAAVTSSNTSAAVTCLLLVLLFELLSQLKLSLLLLLQVLHWWDAAAVGLHSTPLRALVAHPKGFICGGDNGWIVTFRRNPKTAEYSLCRQLQPCAGADILELQLCGGASHAGGDSPANFNHLNKILIANGRGELGHLDGAACFPSSSTVNGTTSSADTGSALVASGSARALSFGAALDAFQADLAATTAAAAAAASGSTGATDSGSVAGTVATASTGAAAAVIRVPLYTPCVTGLWTSATAELATTLTTAVSSHSSHSAHSSDHTTNTHAGELLSVTRQPRTVACRLAQATRKPLLAVLNAPAEALDPAELLIWDYRCREVSSTSDCICMCGTLLSVLQQVLRVSFLQGIVLHCTAAHSRRSHVSTYSLYTTGVVSDQCVTVCSMFSRICSQCQRQATRATAFTFE